MEPGSFTKQKQFGNEVDLGGSDSESSFNGKYGGYNHGSVPNPHTVVPVDKESSRLCKGFSCFCIPFVKRGNGAKSSGQQGLDPEMSKESKDLSEDPTAKRFSVSWLPKMPKLSKLKHEKFAAPLSLFLALVQLALFFITGTHLQFQGLYEVASEFGGALQFNIFYLVWVAALIVGPILIFAGTYYGRPIYFWPHLCQTIAVLIISVLWTLGFVFSKCEMHLADGSMKYGAFYNTGYFAMIFLVGFAFLLACAAYYMFIIRPLVKAKDELKFQIKRHERAHV